jgi:hypothetical protein
MTWKFFELHLEIFEVSVRHPSKSHLGRVSSSQTTNEPSILSLLEVFFNSTMEVLPQSAMEMESFYFDVGRKNWHGIK